MAKKVLIKRYPNRRLYNTETSSFINLNQIADVIREGFQVEVQDVKTKEDITAYVLTQILLEEAKNKRALLPSSLLHLAIGHGQTVLAEFFEKHLQDTIERYAQYKSSTDELYQKWLNPAAAFEFPPKTATGADNPIWNMFKSYFPKPDKE